MKRVDVRDGVGMVLCHDITKIVPGEFKGVAFKKGHVIREQDIPELLRLGKEHVYVLDLDAGDVHEDDAAMRIATAATGSSGLFELSGPREGKVNVVTRAKGLVKVNLSLVDEINAMPDVVFACVHDNFPAEAGQTVAGTRIIPLVIREDIIVRIEELCAEHGGLVGMKRYRPLRFGLITTGGEVHSGRIKDAFGPVIREKLEAFGSSVEIQHILPDDADLITREILAIRESGLDGVLVTGGMSVDPDDVTPLAIRRTGAEVVTYGAPVLPGAMFMLAYLDDFPVLGLPGCVMYFKTTILDLVLPRILVGERLSRGEIVRLGVGGLCLNCEVCRFPRCSFGKR